MKDYIIKITNKKDPDYVRYVKEVDVRYVSKHTIKIISVGLSSVVEELSILPPDITYLTIEWLQNSNLIDKLNDKIIPTPYR